MQSGTQCRAASCADGDAQDRVNLKRLCSQRLFFPGSYPEIADSVKPQRLSPRVMSFTGSRLKRFRSCDSGKAQACASFWVRYLSLRSALLRDFLCLDSADLRPCVERHLELSSEGRV